MGAERGDGHAEAAGTVPPGDVPADFLEGKEIPGAGRPRGSKAARKA
jgi:hypothetical protein